MPFFPLIKISKWSANIIRDREAGGSVGRYFATVSDVNKPSLETLLRPKVSREELEDLTVEMTVQKEYERPSSRSLWGDTKDPVMEPPEGGERPVGWMAIYPEESSAFLEVRLFAGAELFDELWTRHVHGGPMPF